jgi:hypothetical protein
MWQKTFQLRLDAWADLRKQIQNQPAEQALDRINAWWLHAPWRAYHLHWDDIETWPNPWELLSDNFYCDVAKGLGMLYTISLLDHPELTDAELVLAEDGSNLVLVSKRKYILNWSLDTVVNTNHDIKIKKILTQSQVQKKYN